MRTRYLFLFFILCLGALPSLANTNAFITTWKTDNVGGALGTNSRNITIPTVKGLVYNCIVDWGDGTQNTYANLNFRLYHTYSIPGTYTVTITGSFPRILFGQDRTDKLKILSIEQWGTMEWDTMESAFEGCSNLIINATDAPRFAENCSLSRMFYRASKINTDLDHWDVSNVIDMSHMFRYATSFNGSVRAWDVRQVTNMSHMFADTDEFDINLNIWRVKSVEDCSFMFLNAKKFNRQLENWDLENATNMQGFLMGAIAFNSEVEGMKFPKVTSLRQVFAGATSFNRSIDRWNVRKITDFTSMFHDAISFNRPLKGWNTVSATTMKSMFNGATKFDKDIGVWNIEKVTDMTSMFRRVTLSQETYNAILSGWALQNIQSNVILDGGNSTFCLDAATARSVLINEKDWRINDGGGCVPTVIGVQLETPRPENTATEITYRVFFDKEISDVTLDDFALITTGNVIATKAAIVSSSHSVDITIDNIQGTGTIRLDVKENTNITDIENNGNGTPMYVLPFTFGNTHQVATTVLDSRLLHIDTRARISIDNGQFVLENQNATIQVFNTLGQEVENKNLGTGIYVLQFLEKDKMTSKKIFIK